MQSLCQAAKLDQKMEGNFAIWKILETTSNMSKVISKIVEVGFGFGGFCVMFLWWLLELGYWFSRGV